MEEKQAEGVSILLMDPRDGAILAMVNVPEFDLNDPLHPEQGEGAGELTDEERQDALNRMWRNRSINDTYEPGLVFKIVTASAALEEGGGEAGRHLHLPRLPGGGGPEDPLPQGGRTRAGDLRGGGHEFLQSGLYRRGAPLGADTFCSYYDRFGLMDLTGIDLPGEAGTIMHRQEGHRHGGAGHHGLRQSFQVTPVQMAATVSSLINGGRRVTPHVGVRVLDEDGKESVSLRKDKGERIVSEETSASMRAILEKVVAQGSGKNGAVEGYRVAARRPHPRRCREAPTGTSPPSLASRPADDPQVLGMCIIYDPRGCTTGAPSRRL